MKIIGRIINTALMTLACGPWQLASGAEDAGVFADVGGTIIYTSDYDLELHRTIRSRFYHGQPPDAMVPQLRREVADKVVDRVLLLKEASRRGLTHDTEFVEAQYSGYTEKASGQNIADADKEALRSWLIEENLLKRLESTVKDVPDPDDEAVQQYYAANPDKFTEPERYRLSVILLGVAASSHSSAWQAAREEAARIKASIENGADFAELARLHSSDASAQAGGDMGYIHSGMISHEVELVIDQLEVGQVSEPVMVLEGIAMFRLAERQSARLRDLADVRSRVVQLVREESAQQRWQELKSQLRSKTQITIDQQYVDRAQS